MHPPLAKIAKPGITNPVVVKQRVRHAAKVGIPVVSKKSPRMLAWCATSRVIFAHWQPFLQRSTFAVWASIQMKWVPPNA
jgi:hypothetical protein